MNSKTLIKYLMLYVLLNAVGIYIASKYWWSDSLNLSLLRSESLLLLASVGICWIGILYLSILIVRTFFVKIDSRHFIGPIDLAINEMYQKDIGTKAAMKFKRAFSLIAFTILALTIIGFKVSMDSYEVYELENNGTTETIIVKEIRKDIKQNNYVYFEYNNKKYKTSLINKQNLSIGDKVNVIYAKKNPKIIKYQIE